MEGRIEDSPFKNIPKTIAHSATPVNIWLTFALALQLLYSPAKRTWSAPVDGFLDGLNV